MADLFKIGEQVECKIERLAFQGHGIGKPQNFTLFIPRTAPGDMVKADITEMKKHYGYAKLNSLIEPSPSRITPACQYFGRCGGCHYQHIDSKKVEEEKLQQLKDTFERHGPGKIEILPFLKGSSEWNYRNRVTYRRDTNGHQGYTAWDDFETLEIETCLIADEELNKAWGWIKQKIKHISPRVLPFVFLRKIGSSIAIIFSVSADFSTQELVKILDTPENDEAAARRGRQKIYFYTTVIKEASHTAMGKTIEPIFNEPVYLEEKIGDAYYILRPDLFFQTNNSIAELLVKKITDEFSKSKEPVLDIYCGSGLFAIALAKMGIPTVGIEVQHEAVQSAKQSAIRNNVDEITKFRGGKAATVLERLVKDRVTYTRAIVDPPRAGLEPNLLQLIPNLGVQELYYVSCSPPTLARDLKEFVKLGYKIEYCLPLEMFPQTYHVETLTKLTKIS